MLLEEVMDMVYREHNKASAIITLEKHLSSGRSFIGLTRGYKQKKIAYQREYEGYFELEYDPKKRLFEKITVKTAEFSGLLGYLREDYWWIERGIRWKGPPLIPKQHHDPADWRKMSLEPSTGRFNSYMEQPNINYGHVEEKPKTCYKTFRRALYTRRD